ncbi:apolipoprotein N-acyltransferase [Haloechinothrix salitolerans]|uniref:Apolipoprotein N-acyltransferase n=1 Tax=Haloechinothrix salitolerans TaxID=926830 RepID=A0ABW2C2X6_9PSEU
MTDTMSAAAQQTSPAPSRARLLPVAGLVLAAAASGVLLFLSHPPRELWWLAPLAFAGLGLVLHGRRARAGFGLGLVFGLAFTLPHLVWINDFLGAQLGLAPWLALSTIVALFAALAGAAMAVVAPLRGGPVWMAALWLVFETARGAVPLNGFPWGRVAYSQPEGVFTSLAALGGVPLVTFAVVLTGFGLARLVLAVADRARGRALAIAALAVVVPVAAGGIMWPFIGTASTSGTVTVAAVQGNAPNVGLDLLGMRDVLRRNHLAESERLQAAIESGEQPRPDLVVWPETATAVVGEDPGLDAMVEGFGVPALIGALYGRDDGKSENAVISWDPETGQDGRYAKQELVPFAEYVPLRPIAAWFTPFLDNTADMRWGSGPAVLDAGEVRAGLAICYEVAYDYVLRDAVRDGAELLVIPTNNAWYGPGEMTYQQLSMSRLRAVEHGRAAVVAATSGVSAIVAPDGSVLQETGLYTPDSLVADIPLRDTTTIATVVGAWPEWIIIGAGLAALLGRIGWRVRGRGSSRGSSGRAESGRSP